MHVVYGVVFVVFAGGEDGVQVHAVEAHGAYVLRVRRHTGKRAAEAAADAMPVIGELRPLAGDGPLTGGEAVRENVVHHGVVDPVRHARDVRAVVEGQLEVLGAVVHERFCEDIAVVVGPVPVRAAECEIVIHAVVFALHDHLPVVVVFVARRELHLHGREDDRRHAAGGVPLGNRGNDAECGNVEAAVGILRRFHQHAAGFSQAADLSVLRDAAGGFHPQPGNRRLFQRGILQVVLRRRGIYLFQQGAADRFLRKAHGK